MPDYGARNAILGDNFGTDLPQVEVDKSMLDTEKRMAKFSKSAEYQKLKEHLEERIVFYQTFLPDGRPLTAATKQERDDMWLAANTIIGEFRAILQSYENAREVIADEAKRLRKESL